MWCGWSAPVLTSSQATVDSTPVVTDAASVGDTDFEWHEFARIWQTPVAGEDFFERRLAQPVAERVDVFEQFGVPHDQAVAMTGLDPTMAECILALYRSAVDVGREWAPDFRDRMAVVARKTA